MWTIWDSFGLDEFLTPAENPKKEALRRPRIFSQGDWIALPHDVTCLWMVEICWHSFSCCGFVLVFAPLDTPLFFIEWSPQFWLKPLFGFAKYQHFIPLYPSMLQDAGWPDDPQTFAGQRPESCRSHSGEGGGGRMLFRFGAKAAIQGL